MRQNTFDDETDDNEEVSNKTKGFSPKAIQSEDKPKEEKSEGLEKDKPKGNPEDPTDNPDGNPALIETLKDTKTRKRVSRKVTQKPW